MSTIALIDTSWLAHRARSVVEGLSFQNEATGVLFGFFEQLRNVCCGPRVQTNQVAVCFDSRQSFRKQQFHGYKAKRAADRTPEEWVEIEAMQAQVKRLRKEILPACGFRVLYQYGLESDDLMAQASLQLKEDRGVMITSDGDLLQCITDRCHWFDPGRDLYLDVAGMVHRKRVGPNDWAYVKCLAGCGTDNVPGIEGVGEKTAIDYIWKNLKPGARRSAIESDLGKAIVMRNATLITLPHADTRPVDLSPVQYDPVAFGAWCQKLGFASYLDGPGMVAWERFFAGNFQAGQTPRKPQGLR